MPTLPVYELEFRVEEKTCCRMNSSHETFNNAKFLDLDLKAILLLSGIYVTLARGARQLVVQLALETTFMPGSYVFSFTPATNMGASADGADITTFLAPPY